MQKPREYGSFTRLTADTSMRSRDRIQTCGENMRKQNKEEGPRAKRPFLPRILWDANDHLTVPECHHGCREDTKSLFPDNSSCLWRLPGEPRPTQSCGCGGLATCLTMSEREQVQPKKCEQKHAKTMRIMAASQGWQQTPLCGVGIEFKHVEKIWENRTKKKVRARSTRK